MPKPKSGTRIFTPGEAQYVLHRLIKDRRVKGVEASQIADEMPAEIAELERRLAELRVATGSRGGTRPVRQGKGGARRRRRSGPVSPATAESRRMQGEYMGLLGQLSGRARTVMKAIAKERGREAAIKEMRAAKSK